MPFANTKDEMILIQIKSLMNLIKESVEYATNDVAKADRISLLSKLQQAHTQREKRRNNKMGIDATYWVLIMLNGNFK